MLMPQLSLTVCFWRKSRSIGMPFSKKVKSLLKNKKG